MQCCLADAHLLLAMVAKMHAPKSSVQQHLALVGIELYLANGTVTILLKLP